MTSRDRRRRQQHRRRRRQQKRKTIKKQISRKGGKRKQSKNRSSKKKISSFQSVVRKIKKNILKEKPTSLHSAFNIAIRTVKNAKGNIKAPRVIQIPKTGGILPLLPIFAGLSALGSLSGGVAGIAKAVNDARSAKHQLQESQRHNKTMEAIAMGKGLYLKPYKTGMGLFLHHHPLKMLQKYR